MRMLLTAPIVVATFALSSMVYGQATIEHAATRPSLNVPTPAASVNVQSGPALAPAEANSLPPRADVARAETNVITDNRPDAWRYKWDNNHWWYWAPDNRWMSYSDPAGWTYYEPSGSYTAGYGGVGVTVAPAPATTYTYPTYAYPSYGYYGYPYNYYGGGYYGGNYGRSGVYINGGGVGVGIGFGGRGRWR